MQLAFFPWIRLDEPLTLGEVRLVPYRRKDKSLTLAHASKADVDAIFKAYADRLGKAVEHCVMLEIGDWHAGRHSGEQSRITSAIMASRSNSRTRRRRSSASHAKWMHDGFGKSIHDRARPRLLACWDNPGWIDVPNNALI